jgi:hypothetical protein
VAEEVLAETAAAETQAQPEAGSSGASQAD